MKHAWILCWCIAFAAASPTIMSLTWLSGTDDMVCNDGSPYGYYFHQGDLDRWIIHFQGGGWCYDQPSCAQRWNASNRLMSSKTWAKEWAASGEFDSDPTLNPDWHKATYVYLPYCTSDSFSGDVAASASTFGWSFRGKRIVAGLIAELSKIGLQTASEVLLSGCSAGGAAVVANLDYVVSLLPPLKNRNFRGHVDAGWFMWANPYTSVPITMQGYFEIGAPLWGGQPNAQCAKAYPNSTWLCFMGMFALPYFTTPVLVHQEQEDFPQLLINGLEKPWTASGIAYLATWRWNLTNSLNKLQPPHAAFSPACYWHCSTEDETFWEITIPGGLNDRDALHNFFFENKGTIAIDSCTGYSCSKGCPNVTQNYSNERDIAALF